MGLPTRRSERTRLTDPSKRRAPQQEKELAKVLGAKQTSGSGNQTEKGDLRKRGAFRLEAKCTRQKSFSLTREMWEKLEDAASLNRQPEIPVMHVEFLDEHGVREKGLYVLREADLEELLRGQTDAAHVADAGAARSKLPTTRRKD